MYLPVLKTEHNLLQKESASKLESENNTCTTHVSGVINIRHCNLMNYSQSTVTLHWAQLLGTDKSTRCISRSIQPSILTVTVKRSPDFRLSSNKQD